jgi:hypothetical protein
MRFSRTKFPGVIEKVQWTLPLLIPKLFVDLIASTVEQSLLQHANAIFEVSFKKSKTINMSKEIQESLANKATVAPESMKTLIQGLLQTELSKEQK